jgi:hypothetical protein
VRRKEDYDIVMNIEIDDLLQTASRVYETFKFISRRNFGKNKSKNIYI